MKKTAEWEFRKMKRELIINSFEAVRLHYFCLLEDHTVQYRSWSKIMVFFWTAVLNKLIFMYLTFLRNFFYMEIMWGQKHHKIVYPILWKLILAWLLPSSLLSQLLVFSDFSTVTFDFKIFLKRSQREVGGLEGPEVMTLSNLKW